MPHHPTLRICLEPSLLKSAVAGKHNLIGLISKTAKNARFRVEYCPNTDIELFKPRADNIYTLTHMKQPPSGRGLVFRRVYFYPFWQIEQTAERWNWDVAKASFDPAAVPAGEAQKFYRFWQKRLFETAPQHSVRDGYVYVPLQGMLSAHRSFQSCSPFEMLKHTLAYSAGRKVIATLHPNENYSVLDMTMLEQLERRHSNLEIASGKMIHHLQHCDFVVTQNSSAAFAGYFFGKPALLFAGIDFHHIAVRADMKRLADSFAAVAQAAPDYARYVWWFWQDQCINAGRPDAMDKIAARFRRFGWPIK